MIDFTSLISTAVANKLNIIASSNDEHQITDEMLHPLKSMDVQLTHLDLEQFSVIDLFSSPVGSTAETVEFPSYIRQAEVIAFSKMELADDEMLVAIEELLASRSLRGVSLPNLQSVIVAFDFADEPEEIIRLQKLAPAVTIAFS